MFLKFDNGEEEEEAAAAASLGLRILVLVFRAGGDLNKELTLSIPEFTM